MQTRKICETCKKEFLVKPKYLKYNAIRFCTKTCQYKAVSLWRSGGKSNFWLGDKVGYTGIHTWVNKKLKKPERCDKCRKVKIVELANRSGQYKRRLDDWSWLCRKCHMISDGRLKELINPIKIKNQKRDWHGRYIKQAVFSGRYLDR